MSVAGNYLHGFFEGGGAWLRQAREADEQAAAGELAGAGPYSSSESLHGGYEEDEDSMGYDYGGGEMKDGGDESNWQAASRVAGGSAGSASAGDREWRAQIEPMALPGLAGIFSGSGGSRRGGLRVGHHGPTEEEAGLAHVLSLGESGPTGFLGTGMLLRREIAQAATRASDLLLALDAHLEALMDSAQATSQALLASVVDQAVAEAGDAAGPAEGMAGGDGPSAEHLAASAAAGVAAGTKRRGGGSGAGAEGGMSGGSERAGAGGTGGSAAPVSMAGHLPAGGDVERQADAESELLATDRARLVSAYAGMQLNDAFAADGERQAALKRQGASADAVGQGPPEGLQVAARTAAERSRLGAARLSLRQRLRDASTGGIFGAESAAWGVQEAWSPGVPTSAHGLSAAVYLSVGWQSVGHAPSDHAVYSMVRAWVEADEDRRDAMDAHGSEWAGSGHGGQAGTSNLATGAIEEESKREADEDDPAVQAFEDDAGVEGGAWAEFDVEDDDTSVDSEELLDMDVQEAADLVLRRAGEGDGMGGAADHENAAGIQRESSNVSRWSDREREDGSSRGSESGGLGRAGGETSSTGLISPRGPTPSQDGSSKGGQLPHAGTASVRTDRLPSSATVGGTPRLEGSKGRESGGRLQSRATDAELGPASGSLQASFQLDARQLSRGSQLEDEDEGVGGREGEGGKHSGGGADAAGRTGDGSNGRMGDDEVEDVLRGLPAGLAQIPDGRRRSLSADPSQLKPAGARQAGAVGAVGSGVPGSRLSQGTAGSASGLPLASPPRPSSHGSGARTPTGFKTPPGSEASPAASSAQGSPTRDGGGDGDTTPRTPIAMRSTPRRRRSSSLDAFGASGAAHVALRAAAAATARATMKREAGEAATAGESKVQGQDQ